jgi:MscS family membrane protein
MQSSIKSFRAVPKMGALLLALTVLCPVLLRAQSAQHPSAAPTATSATSPADPLELGRETPRGTVIGFIRAAQSENYDIAVQYFEPRRRGGVEPEQELAQQLLAILNARFVGSLDSIPNDATGRQDGGPPREQVVVGGTRGFSESFPLYLVHAEVARGVKVWLISRQTLDQVPEIYDSLRFPQLEKRLPKFLVKTRLLGMPLWQWIAIVLFAPVALLIG